MVKQSLIFADKKISNSWERAGILCIFTVLVPPDHIQKNTYLYTKFFILIMALIQQNQMCNGQYPTNNGVG